MIFNRVRLRCRRILEHLFRVHSAEVFESVVERWNRDKSVGMHTIQILRVLISPQVLSRNFIRSTI